jgi:hypothetical protein
MKDEINPFQDFEDARRKPIEEFWAMRISDDADARRPDAGRIRGGSLPSPS